ncbi:amine dehydrogenase large subunit [Comamonas composti]|uniref:amine dehydrogenase large subunit n=1 Tax=Comamonas composti TaxID=408558 RepID=UPI00041D9D07|nr:amine dehydrogenase large subunit [Comamonas composti]
MRIKSIARGLMLFASFAGVSAFSQEAREFRPEVLTVESKIKPGPNTLVVDAGWDGASRINVLSTDDLSHKGVLSVGVVSQLALSKDSKTAYTVSVYARRWMSGPSENVLQEFDLATLKEKREIVLSDKSIYGKTLTSMVGLSANENYMLVQNATPATSISIVDLKAGKPLAEVPTPGCWGVFPALDDLSFSTICGDGTLGKVSFRPDGSFSEIKKSPPFFDADKDPIQAVATRAGKDLLFVGFSGKIFRLDDSGMRPELKEVFEFAKGVEDDWAPSGVQLIAYNEPNNVLFVQMHPHAKDGSHKDPAQEVWALDMKSRKLLFRTSVDELISIAVSNDKIPVLIGMKKEGSVVRYEMDPQAKFAGRRTKQAKNIGLHPIMALTGAAL